MQPANREVFCRSHAVTGSWPSEKKREEFRLTMKRLLFPTAVFFLFKLVICLSGLKRNTSYKCVSPIALPGKSQNYGRKVQLWNNYAKSLCHRKQPSMAEDRLGNSAYHKHGFPGCNKLAKLPLFDIWTLSLASAQPAAICGVVLEISPWMFCSLWAVFSLWIEIHE